MTEPFVPIPASAIDANPEVSRSEFGHPVRVALDLMDARTRALRTDLGSWDTGGTGISRIETLEDRTTDTTTTGGIGNQRLADRLGSGVGTGNNVTSGSASSQLADLRNRAAALEALTPSTARYARFVHTGNSSTTAANFAGIGAGANSQQIAHNDTSSAAWVTFFNAAAESSGNPVAKNADNKRFGFNFTGYWKVFISGGFVLKSASTQAGQVQFALFEEGGPTHAIVNQLLPTGIGADQAVYFNGATELRITSTTALYFVRMYQTTGPAQYLDNTASGSNSIKFIYDRPL